MVKSQDHWCFNNGNYTSNSTYKKNLDALLNGITSLIDRSGFYSSSYGENPDRVYTMALCSGGSQFDFCLSCIKNATYSLLQLCPYQKQAIYWGWAINCTVRYSNESISGKLATHPRNHWSVGFESPNQEEFNRTLKTLLDNLRSKAAYGGALKNFATANVIGPMRAMPPYGLVQMTLYGLVQCTPDLSSDYCIDCLIQAFEIIPQCCNGKQGGGVYCPSCFLRYETYLFYTDTPLPAPPPPLPAPPPPLPAPPGLGENLSLTSWSADHNFASGIFTLEWDPARHRLIVKRRRLVYWTSGDLKNYTDENSRLNVKEFENIVVPQPNIFNLNYNFTYVSNGVEDYFSYSLIIDPKLTSENRNTVSGLRLKFNGDIYDMKSLMIAPGISLMEMGASQLQMLMQVILRVTAETTAGRTVNVSNFLNDLDLHSYVDALDDHLIGKIKEEELREPMTLEEDTETHTVENDGGHVHHLRPFTHSSIVRATGNFSPTNKLGEGGFGPVYKVF
ncbi:unnamed protein product [Fraxinus pennsylvanica]|uniref:Gnk2-homologous domain-containing protein n=1 Tax=Fraxinus pennsylvanica TaxID=56036 RepID=A0AAD1ZN56_9LAMI|nr:unnamed protein product [Fraxinus pennsylvanica]